MPRAEPGTPKYIANKMKAKGLQKLRWYCQMCQKQCRDENGFKCHTTSESHQRQLLLFAENPRKYLDSFSKEFADDFVQLLKRRFGTKRVHANQVYQEYIADRHHLHMNATRWETLTGFVKWLGRTAKCKVDQTEKGWFIAWIDREPETIKKQEDKAKRLKLERDDEERLLDFINKQVERAKEVSNDDEPIYTELQKGEEQKITFNLGPVKPKEIDLPSTSSVNTAVEKMDEGEKIYEISSTEEKKETSTEVKDKKEVIKLPKIKMEDKRKKTALDEIMEEQEKMKEKTNRKKSWLHEGIVVKVITQFLGEKYYKKKGVILEVKGFYQAIVKMIDSGDVLKMDQLHLETVIPAIGRQVKVVNGGYRGCTAILEAVHSDCFCCTIRIDAGPLNGRVLPDIKYEDISKMHIT